MSNQNKDMIKRIKHQLQIQNSYSNDDDEGQHNEGT